MALARGHASIEGVETVRLRLEVVENDACRKFHADYVTVRTITTYVGPGTQWIEAAKLSIGRMPEMSEIRQTETGDVTIFKGRLWQESPAILHRSPPIAGTGEQRLVLVVDTALPDRD